MHLFPPSHTPLKGKQEWGGAPKSLSAGELLLRDPELPHGPCQAVSSPLQRPSVQFKENLLHVFLIHRHTAHPSAGFEEFVDMHDAFGVNFTSLSRFHFCAGRKLGRAKSA